MCVGRPIAHHNLYDLCVIIYEYTGMQICVQFRSRGVVLCSRRLDEVFGRVSGRDVGQLYICYHSHANLASRNDPFAILGGCADIYGGACLPQPERLMARFAKGLDTSL